MDNLFPTMLERPRGKILVNTYLYWLFGFWFVAFMMKGLLMDAWDNMQQRAIFETISYGIHFAAAVVLFLPRLLNVTNFQPFAQGVPLYLAQLPLHLIACWGYQKTDCIRTPIFSATCVNILACAALVLIRTFAM